jgi:hypothetical protein
MIFFGNFRHVFTHTHVKNCILKVRVMVPKLLRQPPTLQSEYIMWVGTFTTLGMTVEARPIGLGFPWVARGRGGRKETPH